jgi:hypothetical protein
MDPNFIKTLDSLKENLVAVQSMATAEVNKANQKVMDEGTEEEKKMISSINGRLERAMKSGDKDEAQKIINELKKILDGNPDNSK